MTRRHIVLHTGPCHAATTQSTKFMTSNKSQEGSDMHGKITLEGPIFFSLLYTIGGSDIQQPLAGKQWAMKGGKAGEREGWEGGGG